MAVGGLRRFAGLAVIFAAIVAMFIGEVIAYGDERHYVWTYEYMTLERGSAEGEYYLTFSTPDVGRMRGLAQVEHQLEVEVGMTDRFDFAIYQVFSQGATTPLKYDGMKLRWRYRFGEKGKFFVDPLLYAEYKTNPDFSSHAIELKIVLARDFGNFNIAVNPTLEIEKKPSVSWEAEFEYSAGFKYQFHRLFSAGVEFKGSEYGHYVGPVISHGTPSAWVALGSAFKIAEVSEGKPEFQLRLLLGINFF